MQAVRLPSARIQTQRVRLTPQRSRLPSVQVSAVTQAGPVRLVIQGRKLTVTDAIKSYIEEKVQRAVHNFAHTVKEVDVTVSARGGDTGTKGPRRQKVDITIYTLGSGVVRVEDSEDDLYASIDLVCDKVERKLRKVKEKGILKGKWKGRAGPHYDVEGEAFREHVQQVAYETRVLLEKESREAELEALNREFPLAVVRSKVLPLEPQSVEDAVEAVEALGHDFFVFLEKETGTVQVLYKRKEEGYGLLIPRPASFLPRSS